jgi:hypothetical protein
MMLRDSLPLQERSHGVTRSAHRERLERYHNNDYFARIVYLSLEISLHAYCRSDLKLALSGKTDLDHPILVLADRLL